MAYQHKGENNNDSEACRNMTWHQRSVAKENNIGISWHQATTNMTRVVRGNHGA